MFSETTWDAAQAFNDRNVLNLDAQPDGETITVFLDTDEDARKVMFFEDEYDFKAWAGRLDSMFEDDAAQYIEVLVERERDAEIMAWAGYWKGARAVKVDAGVYAGRNAYKGLAA